MDKGDWRATIHEVTELDMTESHTHTHNYLIHGILLHLPEASAPWRWADLPKAVAWHHQHWNEFSWRSLSYLKTSGVLLILEK